MTSAERTQLHQMANKRAKVAKADADVRAKVLLADVEAKLAARFKKDDAAWKEMVEEAEATVRQVNADVEAKLADICRRRGIPDEFRPHYQLYSGWMSRGENAFRERRVELRRVAQSQIEAHVREAKLEIDRQSLHFQEEIMRDGLTSSAARELLELMPAPEDLLPDVSALELGHGQRYLLGSGSATDVTDAEDPNGSAVTGTVTNGAATCEQCQKPFRPRRSDARFCSTPCRVAAYRDRQGL